MDNKFRSIISAAVFWKTKCLVQQGSAFSESKVWTKANVEKLYEAFVENPDESSGKSFIEKLEDQLIGCSPRVAKLAAEMLWVMSLASLNVKSVTKRSNVLTVWKWSGDSIDDISLLEDSVLKGYAKTGVGYNTNRWKELSYFIEVIRMFFSETPSKRITLLSDGMLFSKWVETISGTQSRQFRHILLFLLFPKKFERICSNNHRLKIVKAFENLSRSDVKKLACWEVDLKLAEIKAREAKRLGLKSVDFYRSPLHQIWFEIDASASEKSIVKKEAKRLADIQKSKTIAKMKKTHMIEARIGHGKYRKNLSKIETNCRVTGIENKSFLTASHIKPWRDCKNPDECLDGNNGLWLAPHIDRLFDQGWISFLEDGNIMCFDEHVKLALKIWNIKFPISIGNLNEEQAKYMKYHRVQIFKGA